jgi:hypothetical protein
VAIDGQAATGAALTGRLDGLDAEGRVYFQPDDGSDSRPVTVGLAVGDEEIIRAARDGARALAVRCESADDEWVLIALLRRTVERSVTGLSSPRPEPLAAFRPQEAIVDGETVRLEAREEIVLRCGKGSITLRKDGKIAIKGTHLLSRATGVLRIKGGQVNIN